MYLSVGTAFTTFVGIIIYHVFRVLKELTVIERVLMTGMNIKLLRRSLLRNAVPTLNPEHQRNVPTTVIPNPAAQHIDLRESLLESYT